MKKVILNFSRLSIPEKIQKVRTVLGLMTGNTNFANPNPTLDDIDAAVNLLESSHEAAQDGSKTKKALMRIHEDSVDALMSKLVAYVQDISNGDEAIIQSSGMGVKAKATPPKDLEAPTALKASPRSNSGEAELKWKSVKGAKSYLIEFTTTPNESATWDMLDTCTKAKHIATGIQSVSAVWFRVAAVGPKGKSQWSDPAKTVVA